MTDDKGAGEGPLEHANLRMSAYYYNFYPTGCYAVDRILSAVACAGKAFHNTDCWTEECAPYDGHVGEMPIDWIQNAANDCSTDFKSAYDAGRKAERERCAKIADGYFHARGRVVAKAIRGGQDAK
jgi:hypothetical protein